MQKTNQFPIILVSLYLASGAGELYGMYLTDHGLATNRAWASPALLGMLLLLLSIVPFVIVLLITRNSKKAFSVISYAAAIGLPPVILAGMRFLSCGH